MANALFDHGRDEFANGNIDWVNDTIKVVLVDEDDDTPNPAADENLDDIAAGARVATATLENCSSAAGVCDADDTVFATVVGDECEVLGHLQGHGQRGDEHADRLH